MMELLFIACLVGQPGSCEEKSLQFVDLPSHMACMMGAQPELARWVQDHPDWRIEKWTCRTMHQSRMRIGALRRSEAAAGKSRRR